MCPECNNVIVHYLLDASSKIRRIDWMLERCRVYFCNESFSTKKHWKHSTYGIKCSIASPFLKLFGSDKSYVCLPRARKDSGIFLVLKSRDYDVLTLLVNAKSSHVKP